MIPALAKAIDSLYAPGRFGLSWQSSRQQSHLSVYAHAVGIKIGVSLAPCLFAADLLDAAYGKWLAISRLLAARSRPKEIDVHHWSSMRPTLPTEFGFCNVRLAQLSLGFQTPLLCLDLFPFPKEAGRCS